MDSDTRGGEGGNLTRGESKSESRSGCGRGDWRSDTSNSAGPCVVVRPRRRDGEGELGQAPWRVGREGRRESSGRSGKQRWIYMRRGPEMR